MSTVQTVPLTQVQIEARDAALTAWVQTLIGFARDENDPEMRDNARAMLDARGIDWRP